MQPSEQNHARRNDNPRTSRRGFVKASAVAAGAGLMFDDRIARTAHAAGDDTLKLGLVGCGGRGRGAAIQALKADPHTRLVALGDAFADQIESSINLLKRADEEVSNRIDVSPDRSFVGFDAFQQVIDCGVDVVLLAAPPHFRPQHLEACIAAGKHVFAEKPVAVDAPGVKRVLAACQAAKEKNLAVVSGLCWRYDARARASIEQIHGGAVGKIVAMHSSYNSSRPGKDWPMRREAHWSDMEWQLRNWYWFTWLSGDHIVEQAIHSMDKAAWAMQDEPPASAVSLGGLQARPEQPTGTIFDHHAVVYEHAGGMKHFHNCRQQPGCTNDVSTEIVGVKGLCDVEKGVIRDHDGSVIWKYDGQKGVQMHQAEHDELFASLRAGKPINNGDYMAKSTMLAILGRMASYSGQKITWEQALDSKEDLSPPQYAWDAKLEIPPVAVPGITSFI